MRRLLRPLAGLLLLSPVLALASDPVQCIDENAVSLPAQAPAPVETSSGLPRPIFEGATPPGLDPARPVLVFAHGLHGSADGWFADTQYYGRNDMYDTAYARGYKTFFVDMDSANGDAESSVDNGFLLRDQINWITSYWGVDSVHVVAHSKGAPDANFAAAFGAPIDSVVSLSGANYGSPLADLAQTSILVWLAELIGFNDAGTKFMQTGCMSLARSYLDSRAVNDRLSFYTTAGTGWGPFLSALEFGGLYLYAACPGSGDNDGVVCVDHAKHPLARDPAGNVTGEHRLVWDLSGPDYEVDHDKIRRGYGFFDFFWFWEPDDCYVPIFDSVEPYLENFNAARAAPARRTAPEPEVAQVIPADMLVRGGPLGDGITRVPFPVEDGVSRLTLRVLVASEAVRARLVSPDGKSVQRLPAPQRVGDSVMRGSFATGANLTDVAPGEWQLVIDAPAADAYALLARYESATRLTVQTRPGDARGEVRDLSWHTSGNVRDLQVRSDARRISTRAATRTLPPQLFAMGEANLTLPDGGIYNVALSLEGRTPGGYPVSRTVVLSHNSHLTAVRLPDACE